MSDDLYFLCFLPRDAFENSALWTSINLVCVVLLLDGLEPLLVLLGVFSLGGKLVGVFHLHGAGDCFVWRAVTHPLQTYMTYKPITYIWFKQIYMRYVTRSISNLQLTIFIRLGKYMYNTHTVLSRASLTFAV